MVFTRFTAVTKPHDGKRVKSITIRPIVKDCTGTVYFTDIKAQDGYPRTGFVETNSEKLVPSPIPPRFHNGVVRGGMTVIIPNIGSASAGLDCYIFPKDDMPDSSVSLAQGEGAHPCVFLTDAKQGDTLALLADERLCLKNNAPIQKDGWFQYTAAHDSKHIINIPKKTSARVYFEYREMMLGGND